MKPEIVWVYGGSAAGKATFIRAVLGAKPELLKEFGWQGKRIGALRGTLGHYEQKDFKGNIA